MEVRLDCLRRRDPAAWFPAGSPPSLPVIATCRRVADGGRFRGSEALRRAALEAAGRAGAAFVDVEKGSSLARNLASFAPAKVILSYHNRRHTPRYADLCSLYGTIASVPGASVAKIVTTATDPVDIIPIRRLLERAQSGPLPLAAFAMGEPGIASRILSPSWGSWGTYVCLERGREAAPGQITLDEAVHLYRVEEIDNRTRLTGITGYPVGHSLSPVMHNAGLAHEELNWRYLPFPARHIDRVGDWMRGLGLRGLSVTSPHKIDIMKHLNGSEPEARGIGAVNTVLHDGRRLFGFNTDAQGILQSVRRRIDPEGKVALVLGAGGSARAAAGALAGAGASVLVASRRARPGAALARRCGGRYVSPGRLAKERYDILMNATPVGMHGREMPVRGSAVRGSLVVDLIYRAGGTRLLREAIARGIPTIGGHEILVEQGLAQFSLFTGRRPPEEVMRETVTRTLIRAAEPGE